VRALEAEFNVGIPDDGTEIRHRIETGGGAMMDLGCYPLHWALTVMGEPPVSVAARAQLTPVGVDESMVTELGFEGGAKATLKTTMAVGEPFVARLKIKGSEGEIAFHNPLAPQLGASLALSDGAKAVISPISTYTYQLEAVVHALQTGLRLPTEGAMILDQQMALDAIYEAAGLKALRYL